MEWEIPNLNFTATRDRLARCVALNWISVVLLRFMELDVLYDFLKLISSLTWMIIVFKNRRVNIRRVNVSARRLTFNLIVPDVITLNIIFKSELC